MNPEEKWMLAVGLLLVVTTLGFSAEPNEGQKPAPAAPSGDPFAPSAALPAGHTLEQSLAAIGKLGGIVERKPEPGEPGPAAVPPDQWVVFRVIFPNSKVSDADLVHLRGMKHLEWLELRGPQITDAGLVHLRELTNLRTLALPFARVHSRGMEDLKGLTNLQHLNLSSTQVSNGGLERLKGLDNLHTLLLRGTEITDAGLVHLKGLSSLRTLSLDDTRITDVGLIHLKGLGNLQALSLDSTWITDAGLVYYLRGLANLERLNIQEGRWVTSAGINELKELLPNVVISAPSAPPTVAAATPGSIGVTTPPRFGIAWTDQTGNTFEALPVAYSGGHVFLERIDGREFFFPVEKLSQQSRFAALKMGRGLFSDLERRIFAYLQYSDTERQLGMTLQEDIEEAQRQIAVRDRFLAEHSETLKPEEVNRFRTRIQDLERRVAKCKALLAEIDTGAVPAPMPFFSQRNRRPEIGTLGTVPFDTTVKRIIDAENMLVEVEYVRAQLDGREITKSAATELVWIQGYPTKNAAEGKEATLEGVFEISETRALDASVDKRTEAFVLRPLDLSEFEVFLIKGPARLPTQRTRP